MDDLKYYLFHCINLEGTLLSANTFYLLYCKINILICRSNLKGSISYNFYICLIALRTIYKQIIKNQVKF